MQSSTRERGQTRTRVEQRTDEVINRLSRHPELVEGHNRLNNKPINPKLFKIISFKPVFII